MNEIELSNEIIATTEEQSRITKQIQYRDVRVKNLQYLNTKIRCHKLKCRSYWYRLYKMQERIRNWLLQIQILHERLTNHSKYKQICIMLLHAAKNQNQKIKSDND